MHGIDYVWWPCVHIISMAYRKTAVTPLITHWSYCSLALSHRFKAKPREMQPCKHTTQYKRNYYVKTTFWDNDYVFITLCVCCEGIHEDWMSCVTHEDDTWWRHQMETFSALLPICAIHRSPPPPPKRLFYLYFVSTKCHLYNRKYMSNVIICICNITWQRHEVKKLSV